MRKQAGFTLIEVLLSVAIITTLVGLSMPVYETFVRRNDLNLTSQSTVSALRRAQGYARAVRDDSAWSVRVQPTSVILFKGTDFATRNTALDETTVIPGSIAPSGLSEVQFAKLSAIPNTTGTITLTSSTNDVEALTINAKGMVEY